MKKVLIVILSLIFPGFIHHASAGCGEAYLSITNVATIGYLEPWDTQTNTYFMN